MKTGANKDCSMLAICFRLHCLIFKMVSSGNWPVAAAQFCNDVFLSFCSFVLLSLAGAQASACSWDALRPGKSW